MYSASNFVPVLGLWTWGVALYKRAKLDSLLTTMYYILCIPCIVQHPPPKGTSTIRCCSQQAFQDWKEKTLGRMKRDSTKEYLDWDTNANFTQEDWDELFGSSDFYQGGSTIQGDWILYQIWGSEQGGSHYTRDALYTRSYGIILVTRELRCFTGLTWHAMLRSVTSFFSVW